MTDFNYANSLFPLSGGGLRKIAIFADCDAHSFVLQELVPLSGNIALANAGLKDAPALLASLPDDTLPIVSIHCKAEESSAEIEQLAHYLHASGRRAVVSTTLELLDDLFAMLGPLDVEFLADADDVELILAMVQPATQRTREMGEAKQLNDINSLQRISVQLGEVARSLASLAQLSPVAVRSRGLGYDPSPGAQSGGGGGKISARAVRDVIRARRQRDQFFDPSLFADPAWDILLDLLAARLEKRSVSVSSLCIAAAVPPTTALRWIKIMTDTGLLVRNADPDDARRVFIDLSDSSADAMHRYFAAAGSAAA